MIRVRSIVLATVAAGTFMFQSMARADTYQGAVDWVRQDRSSYQSGKTLFDLVPEQCPSGDFFITNSSTNKLAQVTLLIESLLTGHEVIVEFEPVATGCEVDSVQLNY